MRHLLILLFITLFHFNLSAQSKLENPVTWKVFLANTPSQTGEECDLIFEAQIEKGWYMYSSDFDPNLGPMLTEITFTSSDSYLLIGKLSPQKPKRKFDEVWGGEITYFEGNGKFIQKIKTRKSPFKLSGSISYQACIDSKSGGKCIPGTFDFTIPEATLKQGKAVKIEVPEKTKIEPIQKYNNQVENKEPIVAPNKNLEIPTSDTNSVANTENIPKSNKEISATPLNESQNESLWELFFIAFGAGLLGLLTPCVFPMIPMTVTFFLKKDKSRLKAITDAAIYGLFIVLIYTAIGSIVAKLAGADAANFLSTHWFPNLLFFLVFIVFGLSFLGLFEITLPHSWVNKADASSEKGGYLGLFFMALTLALVSFSCTGPIVGTILIRSANGEFLRPIIGMLGFSLSFALPFTFFAIFPQALKSLPKSGGWLHSVKVVLGFLELALALKFLSIADQVYHWQVLDREVYLALWIAIFSGMFLYLWGFVHIEHDTKAPVGVPRLVFGLCVFAFVIYLIPGLFGSPLKALAGYLPPIKENSFNISNPNSNTKSYTPLICEPPKYAHLSLPHGLKGYFDYDQALACAKKLNKPIFVDFTGHGCVNCREMEASVWSEPFVLKLLQTEFVLLALYVDDKIALEKEDMITSTYDGKIKDNLGKKNADLQISKFGYNAQPYYLILDTHGSLLQKPIGYANDAKLFEAFLKEGIKNFQNKQN